MRRKNDLKEGGGGAKSSYERREKGHLRRKNDSLEGVGGAKSSYESREKAICVGKISCRKAAVERKVPTKDGKRPFA